MAADKDVTKIQKLLGLVLRNPPTKQIVCSWCAGTGIVNCRGMVSSDSCPKQSRQEKEGDVWVRQARFQRRYKRVESRTLTCTQVARRNIKGAVDAVKDAQKCLPINDLE